MRTISNERASSGAHEEGSYGGSVAGRIVVRKHIEKMKIKKVLTHPAYPPDPFSLILDITPYVRGKKFLSELGLEPLEVPRAYCSVSQWYHFDQRRSLCRSHGAVDEALFCESRVLTDANGR